MADRLKKTLLDYIVIAISPALIMAMIGSLVYFLLEVFYHGGHGSRLHLIFALFVFAIVLVARIAIEEDRQRAALFGIPLALVTLMALGRWVESSSAMINLLVIGVAWWISDKIVWDCTVIDEHQRDSGRGLLEAVGLDRPESAEKEPGESNPDEPEGVTSRDETTAGWWQRRAERRKRPHAPGVWIVYFSLAALPLFGVGQLFLRGSNPDYVFNLLLVYTASGLGLLLTTSFLGLRRYLRQRAIEMPPAMARLWLSIGAVMIVALLAVATLLPRPVGAFSAVAKEEPSAEELSADETDPNAPEQVGFRDGEQSGEGIGNDAPGNANEPEETTEPDGKGEPDEGESAEESKHRAQDDKSQDTSSEGSPARDRPDSGGFWQGLGRLIRYAFYAILIVLTVVGLWRGREEIVKWLGGLIDAIRRFWAGLFGGKPKPSDDEFVESTSPEQRPPRPFAAFADPFASGAERPGPEELVRYSFEALEAWAQEHDCARQPDQTPHEFASLVGKEAPELARDAQVLAELYSRAAYAPGTLSAASTEPLSRLWAGLHATTKV